MSAKLNPPPFTLDPATMRGLIDVLETL